MGHRAESIVMQLAHLIDGRFSYYMVSVLSTQHSYLKSGSDIVIGENSQDTTFVRNPSIKAANEHYYLDLLDISVNGQHLNIPHESTFSCVSMGPVVARLIRELHLLFSSRRPIMPQ